MRYGLSHQPLMEMSYKCSYRQSDRIVFLTKVSFLLIPSQCHAGQNTRTLDKSQIPELRMMLSDVKAEEAALYGGLNISGLTSSQGVNFLGSLK